MQNIELQKEVDRNARTVEKQERQIDALESQVGEISPHGRFAKSKVRVVLLLLKFTRYLSSRL